MRVCQDLLFDKELDSVSVSIFLLIDVLVAFDSTDHTHIGVSFMLRASWAGVCQAIINMHLSAAGGESERYKGAGKPFYVNSGNPCTHVLKWEWFSRKDPQNKL